MSEKTISRYCPLNVVGEYSQVILPILYEVSELGSTVLSVHSTYFHGNFTLSWTKHSYQNTSENQHHVRYTLVVVVY